MILASTQHATTPHKQQQTQARQQFSGLADNVSSFIQLLDPPLVNLFAIDVLGFVVPRTALEAKKRGPDAARETLFREVTGSLFNVFISGWIGLAASQAMHRFGQLSTKLNPKAAWMEIHTPLLKNFSQQFKDVLAQHDVSSLSQKLAETFVNSLEPLDAAVMAKTQATEHLGESYLKKTQAAKQTLIRELSLVSENAGEGHWAIHSAVTQQLAKWKKANPALNYSWQEAYLHLANSNRIPVKAYVQRCTELAKAAGLVSHARYNGPLTSSTHSVETLFEQFTTFVSHYADRAVTEAGFLPGLKTPQGLGQVWHYTEELAKTMDKTPAEHLNALPEQILEKLFGSSKAPQGLLQRWLPSVEDGLLPYVEKSKLFLVALPIALTIAGGVSMAYINNYLTRRKYGGVNFFPGEGVPTEALAARQLGVKLSDPVPGEQQAIAKSLYRVDIPQWAPVLAHATPVSAPVAVWPKAFA